MSQKINVNTTPGQFMPTLYYSQGDIGREFQIALLSSDGWSIPAGATVEMVATKPSGFGFTVSGTLSDNTATFVTTETMTNEWGRFPAEVRISSSGDVIGTANFYLSGERDPHPEETIDGDAEEIIPELTLLVERVEAAASSVLDMTVVANTLPAGSDATYSYDEETNTATFGIPKGADGSLASGVLAPTYSSSSTYAVGDYVYYSGNLYRCTTAITTAEAWTSGHWTQVALAPEVTDLKGFLNELTEPTKNLFVPEILLSVNGWQWNNDSFSGAIQPLYDAYKNVSIPITFEANKQYTLSYKAKTDGNAGTTGFGLRFFFKYSDDTTSYSSAINNNVSTYTSVKLTSTAGKTVVGLFVNLGSYGQNIWYIKDIQLEEGASQTGYEFPKNAVDKVARAAQFVDMLNGLSYLPNRYIKYADGSIVGSGTYFKSYYIKNNGFSKVVANLYCGDAVPAAIAFYSSETIGADSYIKSSSVQAKAGWAYHEASVPENCKMIAFTHRTDYAAGSGTPYISLNLADLVPYTYSLAETSSVTANKAFDNSCLELYRDMKPCYDHLYVSTTGNNIVIPSESIYHIRHSRAMGFNVIEANVQKTSDDVFIVHHLSGGKFGDYFHHVDGETDISNIAVSSVTWDWIATNVRYNSQIPKYRTRPCRLEEFLHECKQQNLIPFLGVTSVTLGAVAIADAIMGQYNYIVYGAERKACPNAILYHWVTKETKEEMLAYCESIGKPFIYGISNPHTFTDSELSEIVETLHKAGYCIGSSYIDRAWCKYRYLGFDFNGTTVCMNRIENGNLHNITSAFGFSDYVVTNATETDGVLTFTSDGTIQPNIDNTAYDICGIDIEIWFDGTIIVQSIGEKTNPYTYDSDGSYPIFLSIPIINGSPKFTIDCTLGTVVYDLNFKASVF